MTFKSMHISVFIITLLIILFVLQGCASHKSNGNIETEYLPPATASKTHLIVPISPVSSKGLKQLSELRQQNPALDNFLNNNRKPDYFFSTPEGKIYCIYLSSNNLYTFKQYQANGGPVKFHPLPQPIQQSLNQIKRYQHSAARAASLNIPFSIQAKRNLENTLKQSRPSPYIDRSVIQRIQRNDESAKNHLYYFDQSLQDNLENSYSAKYETRKQSLKMIFPQAYTAAQLYAEPGAGPKKILFEKQSNTSTSFIVPDFFPSSEYYRSTYGNISPAFASLYLVNIAPQHANLDDLHWRYIIRPCQQDDIEQCTHLNEDTLEIRAIVIAATLYNKRTGKIIETLTLK